MFKPQSASPTRRDRRWIAAILLLGLALRIPGLNSGLWFDEVDTLTSYIRLPVGDLLRTYDSLNNHMFFSLQAKLSVALFGEHPWALRLPALLFGLASIWALWRLGRRVAGEIPARLAALLMAVSYHHVWFSQNARGYTGLLFFGLLATIFLVRGTVDPRWRYWLAYGLCLAISMYTHLSAAFLFLAHGLAYGLMLLINLRRITPRAVLMPLGGVAFGLGLTFLLYVSLLGDMVDTFGAVQAGPADAQDTASIAQWANPMWMLSEMAAAFGPFGPLGVVILPVTILVMVFGTILLARRSAVLALILPMHLVATTALLVLLGFRVWPRYFLIDIGMICLVLIVGAIGIGHWFATRAGHGDRAKWAGMILAGLGIAASVLLLPRNYMAPKQDYPGAAAYVEATRDADAPVIALGLGRMPFERLYAPDWAFADRAEDLAVLPFDPAEAWIVYTFASVVEHRLAPVFAQLALTHEKARFFPGTLAGGGIVVLRPK